MITGETPAEKRIEYCDKFNQFDEVPICLVSLKAGGTGLNLVGADIVIHLDPWWNNSVMDQATDRAYRIGQTKNVEVIKLICENSIEQKVIELQEKKKNLIDKIISNDDSSITSLSQEDLKFILE
jgi:SNF2 family DNA or RNA helicase